jgi:hypothetical protein
MISLQRDLEETARGARRARLLAHGGAGDYADPETFALVEGVLRRVLEERNEEALLLFELLDEEEWRLDAAVRLSSHRPVLGPAIVFVKRLVLLPLTRWLYDYTSANFRRQQRLNRLMFACIEELAIENARLRRAVAR